MFFASGGSREVTTVDGSSSVCVLVVTASVARGVFFIFVSGGDSPDIHSGLLVVDGWCTFVMFSSFGLHVSPGLSHGSRLEVCGAANFVTMCPLAAKPRMGFVCVMGTLVSDTASRHVSLQELIFCSELDNIIVFVLFVVVLVA